MTADPTYETIDLPGTAAGLAACLRCGAFVADRTLHTAWHRDPLVVATLAEEAHERNSGREFDDLYREIDAPFAEAAGDDEPSEAELIRYYHHEGGEDPVTRQQIRDAGRPGL